MNTQTAEPGLNDLQPLTVVFRVRPGNEVTKIHASGDWIASSWSDGLKDRDAFKSTIQSQGAEIERLRAVEQKAQMLCTWIAESPHVRGSINGLAAQVLYSSSAALTTTTTKG